MVLPLKVGIYPSFFCCLSVKGMDSMLNTTPKQKLLVTLVLNTFFNTCNLNCQLNLRKDNRNDSILNHVNNYNH